MSRTSIRGLSILPAFAFAFAFATTLSVQALTAQAPASAQASTSLKSNTEKIMLSVSLGGASIKSDDFEEESESGGGFSADLGWGFTRKFTLLVGASGAVLNQDAEEFVLMHFDLLGRFNFANPARAWVPFIEGGVTARVAGQDDIVVDGDTGPEEVDLEISGGGFTFGGGVLYHLAPAWALGANLRFTVGEFSTVKFNSVSVDGFELDATSTRLNFGVTWRPMMNRR